MSQPAFLPDMNPPGPRVTRPEERGAPEGELFRVLVDAVRDYAIFMLDATGRVTSWNTGAERIKGYAREDILGQSFSIFYSQEDRGQGRPEWNLKQAAEMGSAEDVGWRVRKDGSRFLAEVKIYALKDESGRLTGFAKVTRDVTDMQRVREQEAVASLGQLALSTTDLAALMDEVAATVARTLQMEYCGIFELAGEGPGLTLRAGVGWKDGLIGRATVDGRADSPAGFAFLAVRPVVVEDFGTETRFARPPLLEEHGVVSGMTAVIQGLDRPYGILGAHTSKRRTFSPEDVHFLQAVANVLAAAIEKHRLITALEESNINKDQFLAVLSHELRNPLAPIQNLVPIITQHSAEHPVLRQAGTILERQARTITRLLDDLLDVTLVTTGKIQLRKNQVELRTLVERAGEMVRHLIEARGHRFTVTLPPEPVWMDVDPTRAEQVLVNLLGNAAKYTKPGGAVFLSAELAGRDVVIRVRDTGVGIEPEMLPRIFTLFAQVNTALDRTESGLGIGLALVKNLVELHGGTVEAHSAGLGQGSEFIVRLPARSVPRKDLPPHLASADAAGTHLRVLVIDDNPDSADSMAMLIQMHGHEARAEHSGAAALATADQFRPDVVILDIAMPVLDGFEVAARLRELRNGDHMVLVALTGYGQEQDLRRSKEAGFDHHMVKPIDLRELESLLASLAARRKVERASSDVPGP